MSKIYELLTKHWGYTTFRKPQEQIIEAVLEKNDLIAILPTGAGKSLCYQIPALVLEGVCLVITPLIALMEDQVNSLNERGIKALALSAKLNRHETIIAFDNLNYGNYQFLYLSPEKLQSEFIQEKISELHINLIAIDEAHCISQWGHDFRPAYLKIPLLLDLHPDTPVMALTATATTQVQNDIRENLKLDKAMVFRESIFRDNLAISFKKTNNIRFELVKIIETIDEPAIIYAGTRKNTILYAQILEQHNIGVSFYHGGLSNEEKTKSLMSWKTESKKVMVATNAFGMGIDKANVRLIIHTHIPQSIENYVQEIGRAGRDGKVSFAYLLYNEHSFYEQHRLSEVGLVTPAECKWIFIKLNDYFQIAKGELVDAPFEFDLQDFISKYNFAYAKVFHALNHLHNENILFIDQGFNKGSSIHIIDHTDNLFQIQKGQNDQAQVLQVLLRSYGGIHDQFVGINEKFIAHKVNRSEGFVIKILQGLQKNEVLEYRKSNNKMKLKFLVPREDDFIFHTIGRHIDKRNKMKSRKALDFENMLNQQLDCRQKYILDYFSERLLEPCGKCDICLKKKATSS